MHATDARAERRRDFERLLGELRPRLHRYCARMTGSVIDGEDVLQDALGKAFGAFDADAPPDRPEAWLVRIAHNTALDFLRRRNRQAAILSGEDAELIADPAPTPEDRQIATASLRAFMALPVNQRSTVILMDVLGYSLLEIGAMLHLTVPAVKAALHRGRERLRAAAADQETAVPLVLDPAERALMERYVDRFNARDFDAVRDMLAEEVRLDMVARVILNGPAELRERYLGNYARIDDWRLSVGVVEGRPAVLVRDPANPSARIAYFILLDWNCGRLSQIRDFRYAAYAAESAEAEDLT